MLLESLLRHWWFVALVAAVGLWEVAAPRSTLTARRSLRWPTSLTLGPLNGLLATFPLTPFAFAVLLTERGWGLALDHRLPQWLAIAASVCLLDLIYYLQHRVLHVVPLLWLVHRVHHADVDFDYTTGFRFHPIEALLTNATAFLAVAIFGLPPLAVLLHGSVAGGITILEHVNARVPAIVESWIGRILVTPGMHRIHHSAAQPDTDSNFATIFSFWDRGLGTYRAQATSDSRIGLEQFREPKHLTLPWTLAIPFLAPPRLERASASRIPHSETSN